MTRSDRVSTASHRYSDRSGDRAKTTIPSHRNGSFEPVIPRDKAINHLDKLNMGRDGTRVRHRRPPVIRRHDNQYTTISEWQFLRRRSPCVQAHAVPNATVKNPR